jgi:hypothetical protein
MKAGEPMHHHMPYARLAGMTVLSFIAMYVLMYAMVDRFDDVYPNTNQIYMAGLMAAPMVLIELLLMKDMYPNKNVNYAIGAGAVVLMALFFFSIRAQALIGDDQFLRSMIPHHSGAILMCERATLEDPGIKQLCGVIIDGQRKEISEMRAKLTERKQ